MAETMKTKKTFKESGKMGAVKRWGTARPPSSTIRVHATVANNLRSHCHARGLDAVNEASRFISAGIKRKAE